MDRSGRSPCRKAHPDIVIDKSEVIPKKPVLRTPVNKRNSLPSLEVTNYHVFHRMSMFESMDSNATKPRDKSPCGSVETSEKKLQARKLRKKKQEMGAKKKRQADPYAEESTECEEDSLVVAETPKTNPENEESKSSETIVCPHANKSVNLNSVKRKLKHVPPGQCTQCSRACSPLGFLAENNNSDVEPYVPVILLCAFCGNQGCDRVASHKHAYKHFRTPRSDSHCIAINIHTWTVWCYECDSEIHSSSSKRLDEVVKFVKKSAEMAPRRPTSSLLSPSKSHSNLMSQFSGSDSRLHISTHYEDNHKTRSNRLSAALDSIPKVKGFTNLGNTCFFNSVMQGLAQTHLLAQFLDLRLQSGHRITLPGDSTPLTVQTTDDDPSEESVDFNPLELHLGEGGSLSFSLASFLKEVHSMAKSNIVNPSHLFGIICKKNQQFQGYQQQDAHELLRCLLESVRNEEIFRTKKAILKSFGITDSTKKEALNNKIKAQIKAYGVQAGNTIVDEIFGGQMISTVFCESCNHSSQVFEPMMDLSLPIIDMKGKHKKNSITEDETSTNCFGRTSNVNGTSDTPSKREMKRLKNLKIQKPNTNAKNKAKSATNKVNESIQRRMTEKRLPDETVEVSEKQESHVTRLKEKKEERESNKFKELKPKKCEESGGGSSSENEDMEDEDDETDNDDTFGARKGQKNLLPIVRGGATIPIRKTTVAGKPLPMSKDKTDADSDDSTSKRNSRANSDADVEDNADSENGNPEITRQPSIVVDTLSEDISGMQSPDNRLLKSGDHLSCNSASDTSEKYFTAAAGDTMDELDTAFTGDNISLKSDSTRSTTTASSGKGDSVSISSGDTLPATSDAKVFVEQSHIEEISLQVGELKIRRKSDSKSPVDAKRGSTETLHTFVDHIDDDQSQKEKMNQMKHQWMAKSLTTLSPRYESSREECSIMSCLASFTMPELLMGQNKISCDNCTRLRNESEGESKEKVKSSASKQLLIFSPPAVLTLHLKRFEQGGLGLCKVNRYVKFPFVLDIAPFTSSISLGLPNMEIGQTQVLYGLYAIVEHAGRLNSGHYVAYVRSRPMDHSRIRKQLLNLKPSSHFVPDKLIQEMSKKGAAGENIPKINPSNKKMDVEDLEEEIKSSRWFYASDSHVAEVNIEKVAKAQAYLLFYERIL